MLSHHSQLETFTHFFPHSSEATKTETQTQAFQKALWPFLNEKWRGHVEEIVETIKGFKHQMKPNVYRACIEATQRYVNSRDFGVPGRYEVKKSWFFSGIQYFGETAAFHEWNQQLEGLLAEVPQVTSQQKKSWSENLWSGWSNVVDLLSSAVSFAAENPGKAMCSVLALETASVAALSVTQVPYHRSHLVSVDDALSTDLGTTDLSTAKTESSSEIVTLASFPFGAEFKSETVLNHIISAHPKSSVTIEEINDDDQIKNEKDTDEKESHTVSDFVAVKTKEKPVRNLYVESSAASQETQIRLRTAQDNFSPVKNSVQNQNTDSFGLSCSHSLALGFMSSLLTQNPLFLGASTLFCIDKAYGQIVNGEIPDQLVNVGDNFDLKINMTELFGGPVTNVMIGQADGSALPDWLVASPATVGNFATGGAWGVAVYENYAYVADQFEGLKIIDVSNAAQPILKGSISTVRAWGVTINGDFAYVADSVGGLKIIDISNVTQPVLRGSIVTVGAGRVVINGNYAYVADYTGGLKIIDVSNASQPILKGNLSTTSAVGVAVSGNFAYVADGYGGLRIVDVSNVVQPILKSSLATAYAYGIAINNNFAYVADASEGLKIIDISNKSNPLFKGYMATPYATQVVLVENLSYVVDTPADFRIIDVSNLASPILRSAIAATNAKDLAISNNHNLAYLADGEGGLKIIDLTSFWKLSGVPVMSKQRYHILITAINILLQLVEKDFFITTDYFPIAIGLIKDQSILLGESVTLNLQSDVLFQDKDASDTLDLRTQLDSNHSLSKFTQFDTRLYVAGTLAFPSASGIAMSSNLVYITDGDAGLKIIDVSNVAQPVLKGSIVTAAGWGVAVSSNFAYVADGFAGLKIIDVSNPNQPVLKGSIATKSAVAVAISGNFAYVADWDAGLKIINISDPSNPVLKGSLVTTQAYGVAVDSHYAYIADSMKGLKIIDITDPTNPILAASFDTSYAYKVTIQGNLAYISDVVDGLEIVDVSNATHPVLRGSFGKIEARGTVVIGELVYVVCGSGGFKIIDISDVTHLVLKGELSSFFEEGLVISGNYAYVASRGLVIIDLSNYQIVANPQVYEDEGNYHVLITATDPMYVSANVSFILRVEGAPRLQQPLKPQIGLIGEPFSYFVPQGSFWDPNNDVITFEAQSFPSFLTFNPSSATFWGIPSDSDKGSYNITIFATDRITTPTPANLNLLVHYAPTLNKPIPSQVANIGQLFSLIVDPNTFADKDAEYFLTYTAMQANQYPLPTWLNFNNQTQTFSGVPQESNKGSLTLEVVADDGLQGQATATFDLMVEHFPRLAQNFSAVYAAIGHSFTFNAFNYFVDIDGNVLQFSANSLGKGLPPGLTFDPMTCKFSGVPQASDRGTVPITLAAIDNYDGRVQTQFNLTVDDYTHVVYAYNPVGVFIDNRSPELSGTLLQQTFTARVRGEFSIKNAFQDPDGDGLIFSADFGGADNWLRLDSTSGTFSGTPSSADAATYATRRYTIGVTAMDPANRTAAGSFDILLLGPSLTEKILNALFVISGLVVGAYGYLQKKYLLWNWCRTSKYRQPDLLLTVGQTGTVYQVNYPAEKIKSIIVTTIKDRRCIKRDSCCSVLKNTDEYNLPGRGRFYVFDWLLYDAESNKFQIIKDGPNEQYLHEDIEIQIRGADNRIMEQFTIKVRNKNEVQATVAVLSDEPFALQMEEKLFSSSSSSASQTFADLTSSISALSSSSSSSSSSTVAMQSMGLFNSKSKQEIESMASSKTSTLQTPLLNAT